MKPVLYGTLSTPAITAVGVWDPFVTEHEQLLAALADAARASGRSSLAIVLNPDPALFLHGAPAWPVYDGVRVRIALLRRAGVDAVLHVHFAARDVDATVDEFLAAVVPVAPLSELWLGARQSLGNGTQGSDAAIEEAMARRGIGLTRLAERRPRQPGRVARRCLATGDLAGAIAAVGRPPVRARPAGGGLRLAWLPGDYLAVPLDSPDGRPAGPALDVRLREDGDRLPVLDWPDAAGKFLAFLSRRASLAERTAA
jgi:FAD synthase